jgi:hypothetical protein
MKEAFLAPDEGISCSNTAPRARLHAARDNLSKPLLTSVSVLQANILVHQQQRGDWLSPDLLRHHDLGPTGLTEHWGVRMKSLELVVNHVAKFPWQTTEVEVASAVSHGGICGGRCRRSENPRVAFGSHLSGCFDGRMLVGGAVVDAAKLACKCRGGRSRHKDQLTGDCEDE